MLFPKSDIASHLKSLGIENSDIVMLHADAGVAAQYIFDDADDPTLEFIDHLLSYFSEGTVIVPAFTYSATKGEVFDPAIVPSSVGLFSEKFRMIDGVIRSKHPIFSVSCIGKYAEYFADSLLTDCFGEDTFFEKLHKKNAKLVTLGCGLNRLTFTHYVEQKLQVSYRYFKNFKSLIKYNKTTIKNDVRYFVRNLDLDTNLDLSSLEDYAIINHKLIKKPLGRFGGRVIRTNDFFCIAEYLIKQDEYSLIKQGKS